MKKFGLIVFLFTCQLSHAQYWQQRTDYIIDVTLNDSAKTLTGFEKLTYTNHSPDTLRFIWFHTWPNAYKNDRTHFSEQLLLNGDTRFYFSGKEEKGYMNRMDFRVNGAAAKTEDHPEFIDVVKLVLPDPLPPAGSVVITTPFHVKLPFNFSRGGYDKKTFQVTQWYPKPAVYDAKGWHPMPYLDQGEFYSEFGSFDVRIHAHPDFMIAATGKLINATEDGYRIPEFRATQTTHAALSENSKVTWQFRQDSVHDFAWFAGKNYLTDSDTCVLSSGKTIRVFTYYTPQHTKTWQNNVLRFAKDALRFYSAQVGEYPYGELRIVQGPASFGGGMEYPGITVISPTASLKELDITVAHEIGHNWFYGILASNERAHPWMDEGLNSFFDKKYTQSKYQKEPELENLLLHGKYISQTDQPIETHSTAFTKSNYGLVSYYKTAKWFELVEKKMGAENFNRFIHDYYEQWKFRHPQPTDMKAVLQKYLGHETDNYFSLLDQKGAIPGTALKGTQLFIPLFKPFSALRSDKHIIGLAPAVGINKYDGLMAGVMVSNYLFPTTRFRFFASPLYATKSKSLNGIGRLEYNFFSPSFNIKPYLTYSTFTKDLFTDESDKNHFSAFQKIAPGLLFESRGRDPLSQKIKFIEWKSFFIAERPFNISYDSIITPTDTSIVQKTTLRDLDYNIHQLKFGIENNRALYPHRFTFMAEGSSMFVKLTFEGNYFFNYREGGLSARVFAGKFFYDESEKLPYGLFMDRFTLDMSGRNGYGDYTYQDYFIGRNEFEGLASRQISIRDGGFKIRTDLFGSPVGRSDDWLAALNLSTSIPSKLNPLSVLPVKIPLHFFLDIGTYAGALKNNNSGRFLYDAGIHFPLFSGVVNFYFPLVYSSDYRDYVKSVYTKNRLIKASTFSIDFRRLYRVVRKNDLL